MSKISDLPLHPAEDVDGTETLPIVINGEMRRTPARPLIDGLAQPYVDAAAGHAGTAAGAAIAAEAGTNYRATIAAALADFAPGTAFVSPEVTGENPDGEDRRYLRTIGAPGYELTADQPVSKAALVSTADGKGADLLGMKAAGTGALGRTAAAVLRDDVRASDYGTLQQAADYAVTRSVTVGADTRSVRERVELGAANHPVTTPLIHYEGQHWRGHGNVETRDKLNTTISPATNDIDAVRMAGHTYTGVQWHFGLLENFCIFGPGGARYKANYYATFAAAIAALVPGQFFTSDEGGALGSYQCISVAPYYQAANWGWVTEGWGLNWYDGANPVRPQGQTTVRRITIRQMNSGGIRVPFGALETVISDCKMFNCGGPGYYLKGQFDTVQQSVVFDRCAADACLTGGLYIDQLAAGGHVSVRDFKSEANVNPVFGDGATLDQANAIVLDHPRVGSILGIDGLTHISSGSTTNKPGDAILITGGNTSDVIWRNVQIRVLSSQTVGADPKVLSHSDYGITIPAKFTTGRYTDSPRGDFSRSNNVYWCFGSSYDYMAPSIEGPGFQYAGTTPGLSLYAKSAAADQKKILLANSNGAFSIRTVTDAGTSTVALQVNNTSGVSGSVEVNAVLRPSTDNNRTLGSSSFRWSQLYAGTATINTSDEHTKEWLGPPEEAFKRAMRRIKDEIGLYRFIGGGRIHTGVRAQEALAIAIEEGIEDAPAAGWRDAVTDPIPAGTEFTLDEWAALEPFDMPARPSFRHAMFCVDVWDREWQDIEAQREAIPDRPAACPTASTTKSPATCAPTRTGPAPCAWPAVRKPLPDGPGSHRLRALWRRPPGLPRRRARCLVVRHRGG